MQAEKYLRASGLDWTIVRPGGLSSEPPEAVGNLVVGKEDTFFAAEGEPGRSVSRTTVRAELMRRCRTAVMHVAHAPCVDVPCTRDGGRDAAWLHMRVAARSAYGCDVVTHIDEALHNQVQRMSDMTASPLQVGQVCAQALLQDKARNKVVEIVASPNALRKPPSQWFDALS